MMTRSEDPVVVVYVIPISNTAVTRTAVLLTEYLRCSRPLCSSQITGGTHCAWPKPVTQESVDRDIHRMSEVQRFGSRATLASYSRSGPSGPNSVQKTSCSAGISSVPACVVNNTAEVLGCQVRTWSQCQCSTHERHRRIDLFN
jgi:hypothetical protein